MSHCTKKPYATVVEAKYVARVIAARGKKRGTTRVPRGVHPCAQCHAWHITSHKVKAALRIAAAA